MIFLWGEEFVFTGRLSSMKRKEAFELVRTLGGTAKNHVTRKTTYLVRGSLRTEPSNKLARTACLSEQGQKIRILSEDEWLEMVY